MLKPFLFYWYVDAQQGEERAGGRYTDYHVVYAETIDDGFVEYMKWHDKTDTPNMKRFRKMDEHSWRDYFTIKCVELPYDVYTWEDFNYLTVSTKKK